MTTKEKELEALDQIKRIVEGLGADSYVGTALDGCFEIALENITNDFGCSMKRRWESAQAESDMRGTRIYELTKEVCGLNDKVKMLDGKAQVKQERIDELLEEQRGLSDQLTEAHSKLSYTLEKNEALKLEILKLKAKLYDYMVKED